MRTAFSIALLVLVSTIPQLYLATNPDVNLDLFWLFVAVLAPITVAIVLLHDSRFLLFSYLGIFLSTVDDAPVNFDSVFTWPEVTRYAPAFHHFAMEIFLHIATFFFILLAFRTLTKRYTNNQPTLKLLLMALGVSALCYLQNLPLESFQRMVEQNWYLLDVSEHVAAVLLLSFSSIYFTKRKA